MPTPRVVVVGDLLYDLLAKVDGDVTLGTDTFTRIRAVAGGSGANAAAWLASSGIETHFVGRVGDDVFGGFLREEMERAGARAHLANDPSLATGKVFVLVDGAGGRTMITDRGAGEALSPEDLPGSLFLGGHLHLSGYTFSGGSRRETAREALRLARESGMTFSVDPSSVPLLRDIGPERFLAWTRGADLCFPNLEEGAARMDRSEAARAFSVSLSSVKRYTKAVREGRSLSPGKAPGKRPRLDEKARRLLEADVQERPFAKLSDRREYLRKGVRSLGERIDPL